MRSCPPLTFPDAARDCALSCCLTAGRFTTHSLTAAMKAKYFSDTDTLYLELRDSKVTDTRDLDEDTLLDYDADGRVVGITIEHAKTRMGGPRVEMETVVS